MNRIIRIFLCSLIISMSIMSAEKDRSFITNDCSNVVQVRYTFIDPEMRDTFLWMAIESGKTSEFKSAIVVHELTLADLQKKMREPVFLGHKYLIIQRNSEDISFRFLNK